MPNSTADNRGGRTNAIALPPKVAATAHNPAMSPSLSRTSFARTFAIVPTVLIGTMASSDVPFASRSLMPTRPMSTGTMMTPPPTPSSPDSVPTASPNSTRPTITHGVRSKSAPRDGTSKNTSRTAAASRSTTNAQRSTASGRIRSSRVPISAPTTPPAPMLRAATTSTRPFAR